MRLIEILGALGLVAALVSGCALDVGESGPAPAAEQAGKEEQAFDASLFKFGVVVRDDNQGPSGGWQRAIAVLKFVDTRESLIFAKKWTCLVSVQLPIRLNYVVITPQAAAEMTALVADAAGSTVIHRQPSWPISVVFCKQFATAMVDIFRTVPGGGHSVQE
jgi:hypothetical protein